MDVWDRDFYTVPQEEIQERPGIVHDPKGRIVNEKKYRFMVRVLGVRPVRITILMKRGGFYEESGSVLIACCLFHSFLLVSLASAACSPATRPRSLEGQMVSRNGERSQGDTML
jgi:hypothetical protein